jgi:hypothetical protein
MKKDVRLAYWTDNLLAFKERTPVMEKVGMVIQVASRIQKWKLDQIIWLTVPRLWGQTSVTWARSLKPLWRIKSKKIIAKRSASMNSKARAQMIAIRDLIEQTKSLRLNKCLISSVPPRLAALTYPSLFCLPLLTAIINTNKARPIYKLVALLSDPHCHPQLATRQKSKRKINWGLSCPTRIQTRIPKWLMTMKITKNIKFRSLTSFRKLVRTLLLFIITIYKIIRQRPR